MEMIIPGLKKLWAKRNCKMAENRELFAYFCASYDLGIGEILATWVC